jgi:hypothetical protein
LLQSTDGKLLFAEGSFSKQLPEYHNIMTLIVRLRIKVRLRFFSLRPQHGVLARCLSGATRR